MSISKISSSSQVSLSNPASTPASISMYLRKMIDAVKNTISQFWDFYNKDKSSPIHSTDNIISSEKKADLSILLGIDKLKTVLKDLQTQRGFKENELDKVNSIDLFLEVGGLERENKELMNEIYRLLATGSPGITSVIRKHENQIYQNKDRIFELNKQIRINNESLLENLEPLREEIQTIDLQIRITQRKLSHRHKLKIAFS